VADLDLVVHIGYVSEISLHHRGDGVEGDAPAYALLRIAGSY
jgi:hypothetical protein